MQTGKISQKKTRGIYSCVVLFMALALAILGIGGLSSRTSASAASLNLNPDSGSKYITTAYDISDDHRNEYTYFIDENELRYYVSNFGNNAILDFTFYICYGEKATISQVANAKLTTLSGRIVMTGGRYFVIDTSFLPRGKVYSIYAHYTYGIMGYNTDIYTFRTFPVSELPDDPVVEGKDFVGWYYGQTCTGNGSNCKPFKDELITQDERVHAHFVDKTFIVTYKPEGGEEVADEIVVWNNPASAPAITKEGYNLTGWYTEDDELYEGAGIIGDITLTAKWEIKTFYVNIYEGEELVDSVKVNYGVSLKSAMEKAGYKNYSAALNGERLSKENTVIEDDINISVEKLSKWEKFGEYIAYHHWVFWTALGVFSALFAGLIILLTVVPRR